MADEFTPGREPLVIVEIKQPLCANTFGVAPCTAMGTADQKCFNTRATCRDPDNFTLGTPLSLYFGKGLPGEQGLAPYIIPSLVSVSTAPTRINLAGASPDAQGLGNRALCSITFADHQHNDRIVDPYLSGRSWDPMDKSRGSFWTRWLARNRYRQGVQIKVYEGYTGQALAAMRVRTYFLDSVQPPDASGRVTITGKDILAKLEERKAQAPLASPGVLAADLSNNATSFGVLNAVEADYPATGTLRIGDELMTYTGRSLSGDTLTFTGVTRGTDNSAAASHSLEDAVQSCIRYTTERVDDILSDLLTTYGGIPGAWLDTAGWAAEVTEYLSAYLLTTLITEPTSVAELVSEVQTQALVYVWWDERDALVKLKAVRAVDVEPDLLTDEANILEGGFRITEQPRERASQVWVAYNRRDFVKSKTDVKSYATVAIVANLESETDELYGEASIRKVWGNWLPTGALASTTASKIITRYVDTPSECKFRMDAKDRGYWVGDTIRISHYLDVDAFGARRIRNWTIISAEEVVPGEVVEYTAADTTLYGRIHYVMASGAADYPGDGTEPYKNCYIGNAAGLLSDLTTCGRIT